MKTLPLNQPIQDALHALARAEAAFVPGVDSASIVEIPKLALADAVLAAVRLAQLPKRRPVRAVMRQKRRKRA